MQCRSYQKYRCGRRAFYLSFNKTVNTDCEKRKEAGSILHQLSLVLETMKEDLDYWWSTWLAVTVEKQVYNHLQVINIALNSHIIIRFWLTLTVQLKDRAMGKRFISFSKEHSIQCNATSKNALRKPDLSNLSNYAWFLGEIN